MRLFILLLSVACVVSYGYALAGYGGYSFGKGRPDYIIWGLTVGTLCGAAALNLWKNWTKEAEPDLLIFDFGDLPAVRDADTVKIPHWRDLGTHVVVCAEPREAERILARLGWEDFPRVRKNLIASGEISARGLENLCRDAGAKNPFFFGTTPAGREAWIAFGKGVFIALGSQLTDGPSPVRDSLRFDTLEQALSALFPEKDSSPAGCGAEPRVFV
jgi:hypothetical protein